MTQVTQDAIDALNLGMLQADGAEFQRLDSEGGREATEAEIEAILSADNSAVFIGWQADSETEVLDSLVEHDGEYGITDAEAQQQQKPVTMRVILRAAYGLFIFLIRIATGM